MGVPYRIVVEEDDIDAYAAAWGDDCLAILPRDEYRASLDWAGDPVTEVTSSPARNFAMDHSRDLGFDRHWCIDDNIQWYGAVIGRKVRRVHCGTLFAVMEDFSLAHRNVAQVGSVHQFRAGMSSKSSGPLTVNTMVSHVYLQRNDTPFRFRGALAPDGDMSINLLKDGWCTALFNWLVHAKMASMSAPGGLTSLYKERGKGFQAVCMYRKHPDMVKLIKRKGRPTCSYNYRSLRKNRFVRDPNAPATRKFTVDDLVGVTAVEQE